MRTNVDRRCSAYGSPPPPLGTDAFLALFQWKACSLLDLSLDNTHCTNTLAAGRGVGVHTSYKDARHIHQFVLYLYLYCSSSSRHVNFLTWDGSRMESAWTGKSFLGEEDVFMFPTGASIHISVYPRGVVNAVY